MHPLVVQTLIRRRPVVSRMEQSKMKTQLVDIKARKQESQNVPPQPCK